MGYFKSWSLKQKEVVINEERMKEEEEVKMGIKKIIEMQGQKIVEKMIMGLDKNVEVLF